MVFLEIGWGRILSQATTEEGTKAIGVLYGVHTFTMEIGIAADTVSVRPRLLVYLLFRCREGRRRL